jgi:hypothetical protein
VRRASRHALLAAAALALVATLAGGPAADAGSTACKPRGYVVEAESRDAIVIRRRHGSRVYGCLLSRGRLVRLNDAFGPYALAGRYVAYFAVPNDDPATGPYNLLTVRNLANGNIRRVVAAYVPQPETSAGRDGETPAAITDIVLKRNSSVAWISCRPPDPNSSDCFPRDPDTPFQVWRADRRGRKLLDSSETIRLRSLRREGHRISWRRGDEVRTATLR